MPISDLDDDQKFIATLGGDEVVVSAGAGSGKTRLLVGRYLYLAASLGVPPSEIAAITFTNKAADQMKARIAARAPRLAERYPESAALWREVSERIHDAPISTIHSFCNSILRMYPVEAGIDPLFEVLDETTLAGLRAEALDRFLTTRMDGEPERMEFLLDVLGMRGLRTILLRLLEQRPRLVKYLDTVGVADPETLERRHREFILRRIKAHLFTLREFHTLRPGGDSLSPVLGELVAGLEGIRAMAAEDRVDPESVRMTVSAVRAVMRKSIGSPRAWRDRECDIAEVKSGMRECLSFLETAASWYADERGRPTRAVSLLLEEYVRLDAFFLGMKKERSRLDHDDSLIETWRLLRSNAAVCRKVSRSYRHLLVDEFQDTDDLQLDILRMITGNSSAKLFTVGDPKQSIYRFRGADVAVFNRFAARPGVDYKSLRIAYRSTPGIISFVNHVFSRVIGADDPEHLFEVRYTEMKPSRKSRGDAPDVEIAVVEASSADARRTSEGAFIARRALELHAEGFPFGRIALLLRKGTQTRRYEEAFLRAGVPFVNLAGGNPFTSPEAYDIANLLGVLCDPEDDTLLAAALLSPLFRADADFLFSLRRAAGKHGSLHTALMAGEPALSGGREADGEHMRIVLRGLLARRERFTIRDLLESAFEATGYTLALLADPVRGEESLAVLDMIFAAADEFERGGGTVREFARLLREGDLVTERGAAIESRSDALSIITIHKAKGMEYRAVFLADAASRPRSDSGGFMLHDELGPGIMFRTSSGKTADSLALSLARETERLKSLAESKRLFYVACTRAEDVLVISGAIPPREPDTACERDNWMGWLHTALDIAPGVGPTGDSPRDLFVYRIVTAQESAPAAPVAEFWSPLLAGGTEQGAPEDEPPIDLFLREPSFPGKPPTLSPTQAEEYLLCPAHYLYNRMYRLEEHPGCVGERYGELAHHVLERWDYRDPGRLPSLVDELARRDFPTHLRNRLKESLARFADSDLRRMIANADVIRREERFAFLEDDVLIRGTIDLVARTGDSSVILDFKTNTVAPDAVADGAQAVARRALKRQHEVAA